MCVNGIRQQLAVKGSGGRCACCQQKRVICCSGFLNVQHAVAPLVVAAVACTVKSSTSLTFTSRSETLLSMLIRLYLLFGMKRIKLFRLALVPILLSFLLTVFACAPAHTGGGCRRNSRRP